MVVKKKNSKASTIGVEKKTKSKSKKEDTVEHTEFTQPMTVGESLKAIRKERKITLKDISAELNIRVAQLKAVEESDMDQLPGMTYALGFLREYAKYLELDDKEIIKKFKREQGQVEEEASEFKLSFPEPVDENVIPSPVMTGLAAFFCIFLLVVWTVYSNFSNDISIPSKGEAAVLQGEADMAAVDIKSEEIMSDTDIDNVIMDPPEDKDLSTNNAIAAVDVKLGGGKIEAESIEEVEVENLLAKEPDFEKEDNLLLEDIAANKVTEEALKKKAAQINISRKKNRVVLMAKEASWIQVADKNQKVIFRKVLRPGDKYLVPDKKGLTLVTANAGGLSIYVDDKKVQSIGDSGEIVRGVSLNPKELSTTRIRSRR